MAYYLLEFECISYFAESGRISGFTLEAMTPFFFQIHPSSY